MKAFTWPARVYWEDTDGGGVVYYANYLKFMERSRTEWLRAQGFSQQELARTHGIVFAVRSVHIDYRSPARLDDELRVTCTPRRGGGASLSFAQQVLRAPAVDAVKVTLQTGREPARGEQASAAQDGAALLAEAQVHVVCLDAASFKPQRLPDFLLSALAAQECP